MRSISMMRWAHVINLALMVFPSRMLFSETYYVSTQGGDSNPGTREAPWANLNFAITVATAGDTIIMRGGVYFTDEVWIRRDHGMGGADGQYLTIKNFPGEAVSVGGERRMIVEADYVRIEGLTFRLPYNLDGAGEGFQAVNNVFEGPQPRYGAIEFFANNGLIEGNQIEISGGGDTQDHGIYLHAGLNITIRSNVISGMSGYGLHIYDDGAGLIFRDILVEGNVISSSRLRSGIIIAPDAGLETEAIIIRRNILVSNLDNGIRLRGNTHDVEIYNNTIYGNGWGADHEDDASAISVRDGTVYDVAIKNNILHLAQTRAYHIQNRAGAVNISAERNLYCGVAAVQLKDVTDAAQIYGDPWFVDPSNGDFHPVSASPAIDAGIDMGLPFLGDAPDLGAVEFGIPGLAIAPISQDFGDLPVGSSSTQAIRLSNTGNENLDASKALLLGTNADEFSLEDGGAPFILLAGASHDMSVRLRPTTAGGKKAILQLKFNGTAYDSTVNIAVVGFGDPGEVADIAMSAMAHNYGDVEIGLTLLSTFLATNTGALDLQVTALTVLGPDSAEFAVDSDALPFVIAPGDSRELRVSFSPTSAGLKGAMLRLESNDWDTPIVNISLTGNGISVGAPELSVSSRSHDFGNADIGDSLSFTFQIGNDGTMELECYSTDLLGTDSTEFSIQQGGAPFTLSPATARNLVVSFNPTSQGTKSCVLQLTSNDPNEETLHVSLIGHGNLVNRVSDEGDRLPRDFGLKQNYPNPFNPGTRIRYQLPAAAAVELIVFDITGREIRRLVEAANSPGVFEVEWDGRNQTGIPVAGGIYLCRLKARAEFGDGLFTKTVRMLLLR